MHLRDLFAPDNCVKLLFLFPPFFLHIIHFFYIFGFLDDLSLFDFLDFVYDILVLLLEFLDSVICLLEVQLFPILNLFVVLQYSFILLLSKT